MGLLLDVILRLLMTLEKVESSGPMDSLYGNISHSSALTAMAGWRADRSIVKARVSMEAPEDWFS